MRDVLVFNHDMIENDRVGQRDSIANLAMPTNDRALDRALVANDRAGSDNALVSHLSLCAHVRRWIDEGLLDEWLARLVARHGSRNLPKASRFVSLGSRRATSSEWMSDASAASRTSMLISRKAADVLDRRQ